MSFDLRRAIHLVVIALMMAGLLLPLTDNAVAQDDQGTPAAVTVDGGESTVEATVEPTEIPPTATQVPETPTEAATEAAVEPSATTPAASTETAGQAGAAQPSATATKTPKAKTPIPAPTATKTPTKKAEVRAASVPPTLKLSTSKGIVGTKVTATISGFPASTTMTVTWDGAKLGTVKTNGDGAASYVITVPTGVAGAHKVVVAMTGKSRSASFTITPRIRVSPTSAAVGKSITIALTGYVSGEKVALLWGTATLKSVTVSSTGAWSGTVTVPASPKSGTVTVKGSGNKGNAPTTSFTVSSSSSTATPTKTATATATATGPTGTLVVKLIDDNNKALPGACFKVFKSASGVRGAKVAERCDQADGADGTTTFAAISAGSLIISEITAPDGYLPAADKSTTVTSGKTTTITMSSTKNTGFTVVLSDENGASLRGSCFSVYTALDNSNLGNLKASACDDDDDTDDGVIGFGDLPTDDYALVQKVIPQGYARAPKQLFAFTSGGSKAVSIQAQPGGAIAVTKLNEANDPVKGACFDAYIDLGGGALGNFVDRGCNDAGNVVVIQGLAVGNYYLVESRAPVGYQAAANLKFTITAKHDTAVSVVDIPTTKLVVRKQNSQGEKLTDACFSVYKAVTSGRGTIVYTNKCDNADGSTDGYLTLPLSPGSYVLAETKAPKGYLIGADVRFKVVTGLDTALDVVDQIGGVAVIHDIDQDEPWYVPAGACFTLWDKKSGTRTKIGTACDSGDGSKDGTTRIIGLPTGTWYLEQTTIPWGYFESPGFTIQVTAGQTTEVNFYNEHWPLLIIHKVDENGDPLGGACFTAFVDLGGGQRGTEWRSPEGALCDEDETGELYAWVTPGNQILVETKSPRDYLPIQDTPFVMVRGEVTELTVQDFKVASIEITKVDEAGKKLTTACWQAYHDVNGKRGALAGSGCDRETGDDTFNKSLDGVTIINGLEPGDYLIAESTAPKGYFPAADTPVTIESADNEVTIEDEAWPVLEITKVDDTGAAVNGACFHLYLVKNGARGTSYGSQACGTLNNKIVIGAEPGTYILAESKTPLGFITAADVTVTYKRGSDKKITIVDPPAGMLEVTNVNEEQLPLAGACWELWTDASNKPGKKVVRECATNSSKIGVAEIETVPGKYWLRQMTTPKGYKTVADRKVTLVARQTLKLTIQNEPYPRLVINSVDAANRPLLDACFDLYVDGGTKLGAKVETKLCDKADALSDGTVTRRLEPGRYVAREVTAPAGYVMASDIKFTIVEDTDLVLKLSHQLAGVLLVNTTDRASLTLTGACYELWTKLANGTKGVLVAKACDKEASDSTSKIDGQSKLAALPPGTYILSESFAPSGYAKAADRAVTVTGGQTTTVTVINDKS